MLEKLSIYQIARQIAYYSQNINILATIKYYITFDNLILKKTPIQQMQNIVDYRIVIEQGQYQQRRLFYIRVSTRLLTQVINIQLRLPAIIYSELPSLHYKSTSYYYSCVIQSQKSCEKKLIRLQQRQKKIIISILRYYCTRLYRKCFVKGASAKFLDTRPRLRRICQLQCELQFVIQLQS